MSKYQVIVGRYEPMLLHKLGGGPVPAKIDTGAYRSAIHSSNIRVVTHKDGTKVLKATLLDHPTCAHAIEAEFTKFEKVEVTNSFGDKESRYEVDIRVKLGPKVATTRFTLADRSRSAFPILVGRKLLKGRFVVDVSHGGRVKRTAIAKHFKGDLPEDFEV